MTNLSDFKNKSQEQMIEYAVRMRKERDELRDAATYARDVLKGRIEGRPKPGDQMAAWNKLNDALGGSE